MATVMRDQLGKVNWNGELLDHENEDKTESVRRMRTHDVITYRVLRALG